MLLNAQSEDLCNTHVQCAHIKSSTYVIYRYLAVLAKCHTNLFMHAKYNINMNIYIYILVCYALCHVVHDERLIIHSELRSEPESNANLMASTSSATATAIYPLSITF